MTRRICRTLCVVALSANGCGDGSSAPSDARTDQIDALIIDAPVWTGPCWPIDSAVPGGTATMGVGTEDSFQPMPDELQLIYGGQDGFNFNMNLLLEGFSVSSDFPVETAPRVRVWAFDADTDQVFIGIPYCAVRVPYHDIGNGQLLPLEPVQAIFPTCWRARNLIGRRFRIEAEVLDWNGTIHAHDTRFVTALPPDGNGWPDEPNPPGCE